MAYEVQVLREFLGCVLLGGGYELGSSALAVEPGSSRSSTA